MSRLKDPRTLRIFFSSPFNGMELEREVLTKRYFPQIHNLCNQKGMKFVAVDMRWGITSESSANSQVINICLRELDRSDIFVGFFGQRYGWFGKDSPELQENFDNAVGKYSWLENYRDKSVTELEFLHGHLNHPGDLPAVICFRDKVYDDKLRQEGMDNKDKKQIYKYSAESDVAVHLMDDLKQRVWNTRDKTLGVHFDYKDPTEGAKVIFDAIWKHLTEVLLLDSTLEAQTVHSERLAQYNAFLASRAVMYGDASHHLNMLNHTLSSDEPKPIMVIGVAGCGKSTLLCNWVSRLQSANRSDLVVVYHFIGYAENSTAAEDILQHLCDELDDGEEDKSSKEKSENLNIRERIQKLEIKITKQQQKGKKTVIIIDGLEKVTKQSKTEKHLFWLPQHLPKGTILVVSTNLSDADTVTELRDGRDYQVLMVEQLTRTAKQEFCVKTLKESGKELSPSQLDRILQAEKTENPLFLKIILNELVMFGYFRLLDKKIDSLITCKSIDELCENVIQRLEEDYNAEEHSGNLVEQVLSTICLGRQGVSESELQSMYDISSPNWSPLYFAIEKYLINQSGLIQFGFKEFKDAALKRYLQKTNKRDHYLACFVDYMEKQRQALPILFRDDQDLRRVAYELPWAQIQLDDTSKLIKTLTNLSVFTKLHTECIFDLIELWQQTGKAWEEVANMYLRAVDLKIADLYLYMKEKEVLELNSPGYMVVPDLQNLTDLFGKVNCFSACEKMCQRILDICQKQKTAEEADMMMEKTMYSLACTLVDCGRLKEGQKIHSELLEKLQKRIPDIKQGSDEDLTNLGQCYHGLAVVHITQKNEDEAEQLLWKSLECHQMANNREFIATCYTNLGNVYIGKREYEKALEYANKSLEINEELHFGHLPQSIGHLLTNIGLIHRRMNHLEEAEAAYKRSLDIKFNTVGENHPDVAITYLNLGVLAQIGEDLEKGLGYFRKAFNIHKLSKSSDNFKGYLNTWENIILTLIQLGRMEEATNEFRPFFEIIDRERREGNTYLIDGTISYVHKEIVRYLLSEEKNDEALKILLAFMPTKACDVSDFMYLDHLDQAMSESDKKPERPKEMTLEYALERWPDNGDLISHKVTKHIIPSGDSEALVQFVEKLKPIFEMNIYDVVNTWLSEQKPLNTEMFLRFNEAAHKHYPESTAFIHNLASGWRSLREFEKAQHYLIRLVELEPEEHENYIQVAQSAALSKVPDFETSYKYCNMAKERFPDKEDIQNKIKQMEQLLQEAKESVSQQQ